MPIEQRGVDTIPDEEADQRAGGPRRSRRGRTSASV